MEAKYASAPMADQQAMTARIVAAYKRSFEDFGGSGNSMWATIGAYNKPLHDLMMAGDMQAVDDLLRNPHKTDLFYGFEFLAKSLKLPSTPGEKANYADAIKKILVDLVEVIGGLRATNPTKPATSNANRDVDVLIDALDFALGYPISFPNPFPFEPGLASKRGVMGSRALWAIYQAWRLRTLTKGVGKPKILEIGAGLGRTAFYSMGLIGTKDYTIIDLPMANVAQASFLIPLFPRDAVSLSGEGNRGAVRIENVNWRPGLDEKFDVVLNVDSLTEMDRSHAERYMQMIAGRTKFFVSINHEANSFTVSDLIGYLRPKAIIRNRFSLRPGYIEEIAFL